MRGWDWFAQRLGHLVRVDEPKRFHSGYLPPDDPPPEVDDLWTHPIDGLHYWSGTQWLPLDRKDI